MIKTNGIAASISESKMVDSSKVYANSRQSSFFHICEECRSVCCKEARPPLTSERISTIKEYLSKRETDVKKPFKRSGYSFPRETSDGYCIFFDDEAKKCKIHALKPETCVAGPITFDINVGKGVIEWYLKTEKICKLAGILSRDDEMLKKHLKSAKREINNLLRSLSKEELLTILTIDEPDTFKIDEDKLDSETLKKLR